MRLPSAIFFFFFIFLYDASSLSIYNQRNLESDYMLIILSLPLFFQAEIDGRKTHFSSVREQGNNLINSKHYASDDVQKMVKQLDTTRLALGGAWDKRNVLLTQCHNLQVKINFIFHKDQETATIND